MQATLNALQEKRLARIDKLQNNIKRAETWTWMQGYVSHWKTELAIHQEISTAHKDKEESR